MVFDPSATVLVGAIEGQNLTEEERRFFAQTPLSGVTLFGRNIDQDHHDKIRDLIADLSRLQPHAAPPLMIAVDQEGGRVARFRGRAPNDGPALDLVGGLSTPSALGDLHQYGARVGRYLAHLGINVNFAPVLDVLSDKTHNAIGDRAFGRSPDTVTQRAEAFLDGLLSTGVMGCLKHFPGQGDATVDTHLGAAVVDLDRPSLEREAIAPFRSLVSKSPMVMIAHCVYPALDPLPASQSRAIMHDLLRVEMGYQGVIVSDDMTMGAVPQDENDWRESILAAIHGGADMLLVCRHVERMRLAYETLTQAAKRSPETARRLEEAALRVLHLRRSFHGAPDKGRPFVGL